MEKKREIHGIDQAVCLFMFGLDRVFASRVYGWKRPRNGFGVFVLKEEPGDVTLRINPIGLPDEDYVACRFMNTLNFWYAEEGHISYSHSATEIRGLNFNVGMSTCYENIILEALIKPRDYSEKIQEILVRRPSYSCQTV